MLELLTERNLAMGEVGLCLAIAHIVLQRC